MQAKKTIQDEIDSIPSPFKSDEAWEREKRFFTALAFVVKAIFWVGFPAAAFALWYF